MDRIAITGGARLEGEIPISGAKNSAIKLMAASLLTDEPLTLTNMPRLADTKFLGVLLRRLGTEVVERDGEGGAETVLSTPEITSGPLDADPIATATGGTFMSSLASASRWNVLRLQRSMA